MAATIDIPGLGKKRFEDVDDFRDWLQAERKHYDWVTGRFPQEIQRLREHWKQSPGSQWWRQIPELLSATEAIKGHEWSDETIEKAQAEIQNKLEKGTALWRETTEGEYIDAIRSSRNDTCALGALVYLSGADVNPPQIGSRDFWDGWLYAFLYSNGLQKSVPKHYRRIDSVAEELRGELSVLNSQGREALADVNYELQTLKQECERTARRSERQVNVMTKLRKRYIRMARQKFDEQYRMIAEHISMHKSVEHWEGKATDFARESRRWGVAYYSSVGLGTMIILSLIVVAAVLLVVAPQDSLERISSRFELIGNFYILVTGGVAIVIGMWLWATRMFGRLYLQARAQKEDAEHRVTAIKSYLAMLTDEGAFEKDTARELILPAIFGPPQIRPTEAGGPPLSVDRVMRGIGLR